MKVLVIPNVHLKPWMFQRASELIKETESDLTICLMDIADDWRQQFNLDLYIQTYDAAIDFAKEYPETLWCYGNHDVCYLCKQRKGSSKRYLVNDISEPAYARDWSLVYPKHIKEMKNGVMDDAAI